MVVDRTACSKTVKTSFIFAESFSTRPARKPVMKSRKILIFFIASLKLRNSKVEFYRCKNFHRRILSIGHIEKLTAQITDYIMTSETDSGGEIDVGNQS